MTDEVTLVDFIPSKLRHGRLSSPPHQSSSQPFIALLQETKPANAYNVGFSGWVMLAGCKCSQPRASDADTTGRLRVLTVWCQVWQDRVSALPSSQPTPNARHPLETFYGNNMQIGQGTGMRNQVRQAKGIKFMDQVSLSTDIRSEHRTRLRQIDYCSVVMCPPCLTPNFRSCSRSEPEGGAWLATCKG